MVALNAAEEENLKLSATERAAKKIRDQTRYELVEPETSGGEGDAAEDGTKRSKGGLWLDPLLFIVVFSIMRMNLRNSSLRNNSRDQRRMRRLALESRQERFRSWVGRLNQQRSQNGQRPISIESLQLVMGNRELNGEDYDGLLQFDEEAGPAMETLLNSIGATQEEIDRCPTRVLGQSDELLTYTREGRPHSCAVCLENYTEGELVRSLPCFHNFHRECIDPWLLEKALCPICKHNAVT